MEQIGYLYRFHKKYCNTENELCTKKTTKYIDRINDGILRIKQINRNIQKGGNKKKLRIHKKTRRIYKKSRYVYKTRKKK